ncbi:prepilin-type N-terminal cleavage/methylation domain-containing protein [Rheinheimera texasensis]|uniref:PilW family protein n=1 Tax=Rheinheimera texasensis TaxID=306205 RepID=UPI0032B2B5FE
MKLHRHSTQHGLTLIELMIGLSLGLVMLGSVISVMVAGNTSYQNAQRFSNLQSEFGFISDSLMVDLRGATAVAVTGGNTVLTITTAAGPVVYRLDADSNLQRQLNADPVSLIAENVNLFNLACLDETRAVVNCAAAVTVESTVELSDDSAGAVQLHRLIFATTLRNAILAKKFAAI